MRIAAALGFLLAYIFPASAGAEPPPLSFTCDAAVGVSCETLGEEVAARLAEAGREVRSGRGRPHANVARGPDGRARVEIEVAGRPTAVRDVDLAGDPSPTWTLALTIEEMLELEEAAAGRPRRRATPPPRTTTDEPRASELWIGLLGGARMDMKPGVALVGGGLGVLAIGRFLLRMRAYGEYAPHDPFQGDALGLAVGAGWRLVDRPSFRLAPSLEAFFRFAGWRYEREGHALGPEAGAGLWLDATFGRWVVRPYAALGLEVFFARQKPVHVATDETLRPSLVAPTAQLGLVYHPG